MKSNKLTVMAGLILASAGIQAGFMDSVKTYGSQAMTFGNNHKLAIGGTAAALALTIAEYIRVKKSNGYKLAQYENTVVTTNATGMDNNLFKDYRNIKNTADSCKNQKNYAQLYNEINKHVAYSHLLARKVKRNPIKTVLGLATIAALGFAGHYGYNHFQTPKK